MHLTQLRSPHTTSPLSHVEARQSMYSSSVNITVGVHHDPNPKFRPTMEDKVTVHSCVSFPGLFVAVYDGHGGITAASYLDQLLHRLFLDELLGDDLEHESPPSLGSAPRPLRPLDDDGHSACSTPPYDDMTGTPIATTDDESGGDLTASTPITHPANTPSLDVANAFRKSFAKMDTVLRFRNCVRVGATAVTAFVRRLPTHERILTVANCGDSRAVLARAGRPVGLTTEHRPLETERTRIENSGGFVMHGRVNGLLNVSRAFGDHCMKSLVICTPSISEIYLSHLDDFVILACDGLWDFVSDSDAVAIARLAFDKGLTSHDVAKCLVDEAISRKSTDNVSVVVLNLNVDEE